jgi:bifunctional DNase/RNase
MIETKVEDVLVRVAPEDPMRLAWFGRIIILKEREGDRVLPIWTGPPEADLLFMSLQGVATPRPMPHVLMAEIIRVMGGRVDRVAITHRSEIALHATISLAVGRRAEDVDARPTDALLLALATGAPIFVVERVLHEAGVPANALNEKLPPRDVETEVMARGEWRSLSAELLRSLHRAQTQK